MMPFEAQKDMEVQEGFVLSKGSILIADIWKPTIEGFPEGHLFNPDRMLPENREDLKFKESFLTFGTGPHACVGQNYAINHLTAFLAELANTCEWERKLTSKSRDFEYLPTVNPGDCLIRIKARN